MRKPDSTTAAANDANAAGTAVSSIQYTEGKKHNSEPITQREDLTQHIEEGRTKKNPTLIPICTLVQLT